MLSRDLGRRVLVVGSPGAGKTTLARTLRDQLHLPLVHLDDVYWDADWARPSQTSWRAKLAAELGGESWIIDGNYAASFEERLKFADSVVFLDTSTLVCLRRIIWRSWRIRLGDYSLLPMKIQPGRAAVNKPRATTDFTKLVRLVISFKRDTKPEMLQLIEKSGARLVLVKSK